jgi:predicted nuclease of predicted toxin-antitoxin system
MKLLTDQDVYVITVRYLRNLGYDVITAYEIGLSKAKDIDLLKKAKEQNWLFVTRDREARNLHPRVIQMKPGIAAVSPALAAGPRHPISHP